ncbi:MAG: hypothetical protein WB711_18790, partial [Terriglobales bacterium]
MHYERAPGLSGWDGWRRLRSATLCGASLRSGGERVGVRGKEVAGGHRQIGGSMALYLGRR